MTRDTGSRAFLAGTLFVAVALFSAIAVAQTGLIQPTEEDTESRAVLDSVLNNIHSYTPLANNVVDYSVSTVLITVLSSMRVL